MIPTTTMQLGKPEAGDEMEPYFLGTTPALSFWEALERLSEHDHTGGLLGKPISAATIPDGSITTSKLDPSVLAPYALTDGSKPFSGLVTMQADAVVRDRLSFGEQGTALAPDAYWERSGVGALRTGGNVGVGVAPEAWGAAFKVLRLGQYTSLYDVGAGVFGFNTYNDGASKAITNAAAGVLVSDNTGLKYMTAPAVAAGAAQTFTTRLTVDQNGTTTHAPAAGARAIAGAGNLEFACSAGGAYSWYDGPTNKFSYFNNQLYPQTDNQMSLGNGTQRWSVVYAAAGTINTSSRTHKDPLGDLDPEAALRAVLRTPARRFRYTGSALVQSGYYLEEADPLFTIGPDAAAPSNDTGILIAAVQALCARVGVTV